jgi:hypothetical protein
MMISYLFVLAGHVSVRGVCGRRLRASSRHTGGGCGSALHVIDLKASRLAGRLSARPAVARQLTFSAE